MSKIGTVGLIRASSSVIGVRLTDDSWADPSYPSADVPVHPARLERPPVIAPDVPSNQLEEVGVDTDC
jgi:hypothetical protein